jgi:hypothetical protein
VLEISLFQIYYCGNVNTANTYANTYFTRVGGYARVRLWLFDVSSENLREYAPLATSETLRYLAMSGAVARKSMPGCHL